ncbi:tetratricopeptide repeat protein [Candidatus Sumerlaeota bacterium]|nr:tetratricopeptide repeat protein [Candidatus Sumerlaeota bacterium]
MRQQWKYYVVLFFSLLMFCLCAGDVVILTNGDRLEGIAEPVRGEPGNILMRTGAVVIKIKGEQIRKIIKEPEAMGHLKIGNQLMERQEYESAIKEFKQAYKLDPTLKDVQQRIAIAEELLRRRKTEQEKERLLKISKLISEARMATKERHFEDAVRLLTQAELMNPSDKLLNEIRTIKIDALIGLGLNQLDKLNEAGAMATFQKVLLLDPTNEVAQKQLIKIWERDPSRLDDIIKAYEKILASNPDDKTTIYKLANALFDKRKFERALSYYERLLGDKSFNQEFISTRIRNILTRLHTLSAQALDYKKAKKYYKKMMELFPDVDPTTLYLYEYAERKQQIDPKDINARLALAEYCKQHKLDEYAEKEYREILKLEPENQKALDGLTYYAQKMFSEAQYFFDSKQYHLAIKTAQKILEKYPQISTVTEKTADLIERANNELRLVKRLKETEAKELAQRGNEYFQRAEEFINMMRSTERKNNVRIISDREEAKKYLRRAILAWEKALEIDPSLAELSSEDLAHKLGEARARLRVLESPVPMKFPLPRRSGD